MLRCFLPTMFGALMLFVANANAQTTDWTQTPGSNRFGVGLNGLSGTHATPDDTTGWGIATQQSETPPPPMASHQSQLSQSPESRDDLGGLLPPLDAH